MNLLKHVFGFPLYQVFRKDIIPLDRVKPTGDLSEIMKRVNIIYYKDNVVNDKAGRIDAVFLLKSDIVFELVGLTGFQFVLAGSKLVRRLKVKLFMTEDFFKVVIAGEIKIRISPELFLPVKKQLGRWKVDHHGRHVEIILSRGIVIDHDWNIFVNGLNQFSFGPAIITGSQCVVKGKVELDLSLTNRPEVIIFKTVELHPLNSFHFVKLRQKIQHPDFVVSCRDGRLVIEDKDHILNTRQSELINTRRNH